MTQATIYILGAVGLVALLAVTYFLGMAEGFKLGRLAGYDEAADECRRRCANA